MSTKINGETLELARQLRQKTQKEVAQAIGISQGQLSKAEHNIQELDFPTFECLAAHYNFPVNFFFRELDPTPVSHFCYRKKMTSNKVLDSFIATVQIFKIFVEDLFSSIELPEYDLPSLVPSEDLTVEEIADRIRYVLGVFKGPVPNLTTLLENHGIIISKIDFGTDKLDGLSTYNSKGRRIIFINNRMPNDRIRFSLAHELGHTIMHMPQLPDPSRDVEAEANRFAAQFLMPDKEIAPMLVGINIYDLELLKKKWKVSMKALLYRAKSLMTISEKDYRNLQIFYSKKGYNHGEPSPLAYETPSLIKETISLYKTELGYSEEDLMNLMTIGMEEYHRFFSNFPKFKLNPIFSRRQ
ncbi:MAG: ImmA/IrrE family metallo-endopeptidase [Muribaculum sp.]|nr:ImmA/IrrE family metallo-endopeptidase [Muribaculum sp.]